MPVCPYGSSVVYAWFEYRIVQVDGTVVKKSLDFVQLCLFIRGKNVVPELSMSDD